MKKHLLSIAACVLLASSAYAIDAAWTKTLLHYTVYGSGTSATTTFTPPTTVPSSTTSITSVTYAWNPYPNGNTSELVLLCYTQPYGTNVYRCVDVTANRTRTLNDFNTLSARGSFSLKHTLTGGTYPATASGVSDTVTVNYSF